MNNNNSSLSLYGGLRGSFSQPPPPTPLGAAFSTSPNPVLELKQHQARNNGTSEWVMSGGRTRGWTHRAEPSVERAVEQSSSWSLGRNRFDNSGVLESCISELLLLNQNGNNNNWVSTSKLDPNSKPFSPRKVDENDNIEREERLRQIWQNSPPELKNGLQPPPPPPPPSAASSAASDDREDDQKRPLLPTPADFPPFGPVSGDGYSGRKRSVSVNDVPTCELALKAKHVPVSGSRGYGCLQDEYGLRSLARSIAVTSTSLSSDTSSVLDKEDLGFSEPVRRHFSNPAYNYMESPFNGRVVTPLSGYQGVPEAYLHGLARGNRLPAPELHTWPSDLLFFLFYTAVGDELQLLAGVQLFNRGWRFHKVTGQWIARIPEVHPDVRTKTYEKGYYQYFDVKTWRRINAHLTLVYADLAEALPLANTQGGSLSPSAILSNLSPAAAEAIREAYQAAAARKRRESDMAAAAAHIQNAARMKNYANSLNGMANPNHGTSAAIFSKNAN